jgi:hypothetical protein
MLDANLTHLYCPNMRGGDHLTMSYLDNLDNEFLNKYEKRELVFGLMAKDNTLWEVVGSKSGWGGLYGQLWNLRV